MEKSFPTGGHAVSSLSLRSFVRWGLYEAFPKYSGTLTAESSHATELCFVF